MTAHTARKVLKKYMQAGCVEKYWEKYCPGAITAMPLQWLRALFI